MRIDHVALWTRDLERSRDFYVRYFDGASGMKYHNPRTGFESYFISFADGARLEIMQMSDIPDNANDVRRQALGWIHIAFAVGSKAAVDALTERLRTEGYTIIGEPRTTGDGYYESGVLDPDNNRIEITI